MIRHRPYGKEHPYRFDADQRVPPRPLAGQPFELRATTGGDARRVWVETERNGSHGEIETVPLGPLAADGTRLSDGQAEDRTAGTGHLEAAANRALTRRGWFCTAESLEFGESLRYRFREESRSGVRSTRWHEVSPVEWRSGGGELVVEGDPGGVLFVPGSTQWLTSSSGPVAVRFALRLEPEERVVGLGERFDSLDQRGRRTDSIVFEQYKNQGSRTYMPMPYAIVAGGRGWGFWIRTSRRVRFDFGATDPQQLWIEVELDFEGRDRTLHLVSFAGSPYQVLASFLRLTGWPKLPPDWVFRPWMSGNEWNTQQRVEAEVARSQAEGIPVGVLVIEAWLDETTLCIFRDSRYEVHADGSPHRLEDFTFPPDGAWPDPKGLADRLHDAGIRLVLWQAPLLRAHPTPTGQLAADRAALVRQGFAVREADGRPYRNRGWWFPDSLLPDFTSADARRWWASKRRYLVDQIGVDGFKTDGGEHAWGRDLRYADGTRGDESNSRYPVLYAQAFHELMTDLDVPAVTFSRAGYTGAAAYPMHWAGDENSTWEAFRASITAGLSAGASGIFFWGWDLGGFSGEIPDAELYLRSAAMAALCPVMQYHSEFHWHRKPCRDRTPWNIAERTGDARVVPIYRRFARLRERLVPYLVREARRSVEEARPLMRALFFDWPGDPEIWRRPFEYMLGDELLVVPVTEPGASTWPVYLPEGEWVDPWRGDLVTGPCERSVPVPIAEIPVFIRARSAPAMRALFRDPDEAAE